MSFITINAEFSLLCEYLKRIADAMDRAYPVPIIPEGATAPRKGPAGPEAIGYTDDETIWQNEQADERSARNELFKSHPLPISNLEEMPHPAMFMEEEPGPEAREMTESAPEPLDETEEIELSPETSPEPPSPPKTE